MNNLKVFDNIPFEDLGNGLKRKILAYNEDLMVVYVHFEKDSVGEKHTHVNSQVTYCLSGKFEYYLNDEIHILNKGDSIVVDKNLIHGLKCLEEGVVLDIFSPYRKDFIK